MYFEFNLNWIEQIMNRQIFFSPTTSIVHWYLYRVWNYSHSLELHYNQGILSLSDANLLSLDTDWVTNGDRRQWAGQLYFPPLCGRFIEQKGFHLLQRSGLFRSIHYVQLPQYGQTCAQRQLQRVPGFCHQGRDSGPTSILLQCNGMFCMSRRQVLNYQNPFCFSSTVKNQFCFRFSLFNRKKYS